MTGAVAKTPAAGGAGLSCGARLHAAREARGLSQEEIARRLNLDVRKIVALEADDYAALPATLYVRGYIRAIAGLLGADGAALIAAYEAQREDARDPELTTFASGPPVQPTASSSWVKAVTGALVLTLAVMIIVWWQNSQFGDYFRPGPQSVESTPPPAAGPALGMPDVATLVASPAPLDAQVLDLESMPGAHHEPGTLLAGDLSVTEIPVLAPDTPASLPATAAAPATDTPAVSDTTPAPDAAAVPPAGTAEQDLVVTVREDAWIEIVDATGRRLHYDLGRPGQRIAVSGTAPYRLLIGNAPAVEVRFRGAPVDLLPLAREGVARLSLGE